MRIIQGDHARARWIPEALDARVSTLTWTRSSHVDCAAVVCGV